MTDEILPHLLLCLSFSSLIETRTRWVLFTKQQATLTCQDSRIPVNKSEYPLLPADCMWRAQVCYRAPSSADRPQDIHRSLWNWRLSVTSLGGILYERRLCSQCCSASSGTSNLRRELTFSQTVVFWALYSGVMCDVHVDIGSTKIILLPLFLDIMKLHDCALLITLCTKTMETSIKMF